MSCDAAVSQLACGDVVVVTVDCPAGWVVRTRRAPILRTSREVSQTDLLADSVSVCRCLTYSAAGALAATQTVSRRSHVAWKRELSLTQHAGLELPEALYGGSSLELRHIPSGVRISFCALEVPQACNCNCRGTPR